MSLGDDIIAPSRALIDNRELHMGMSKMPIKHESFCKCRSLIGRYSLFCFQSFFFFTSVAYGRLPSFDQFCLLFVGVFQY